MLYPSHTASAPSVAADAASEGADHSPHHARTHTEGGKPAAAAAAAAAADSDNDSAGSSGSGTDTDTESAHREGALHSEVAAARDWMVQHALQLLQRARQGGRRGQGSAEPAQRPASARAPPDGTALPRGAPAAPLPAHPDARTAATAAASPAAPASAQAVQQERRPSATSAALPPRPQQHAVTASEAGRIEAWASAPDSERDSSASGRIQHWAVSSERGTESDRVRQWAGEGGDADTADAATVHDLDTPAERASVASDAPTSERAASEAGSAGDDIEAALAAGHVDHSKVDVEGLRRGLEQARDIERQLREEKREAAEELASYESALRRVALALQGKSKRQLEAKAARERSRRERVLRRAERRVQKAERRLAVVRRSSDETLRSEGAAALEEDGEAEE